MRLPRYEHQEPVQARHHERRQFRVYPDPQDAFEPVTRTPEEVNDAIYRSEPLPPAAPRLGVAESSFVAVPTSTRPLSSMLIPSSTPVPSTLVVSTLTASPRLIPTPSASGGVLVNETNQSETTTASASEQPHNPWLIPNESLGSQVIIYAVFASLPAMLILIILVDAFRRLRDKYHEYQAERRRAEIVKAEKVAALKEEGEANNGDDNENNGDGNETNDGGVLNEAKKSSSTDSTAVAKTNMPPVSVVTSAPAVVSTAGAPAGSSQGGSSSTGGQKFKSTLDIDGPVPSAAASINGGPPVNSVKKVIFHDPDSITPAPNAHLTLRTAAEAKAATEKSIQQSNPTDGLAAPRWLTNNNVVMSCCKSKAEDPVTTTNPQPFYTTSSSTHASGSTASSLLGAHSSTLTNGQRQPTTNTIVGSSAAANNSGDNRLSKISEKTETERSIASSAESLNTAMRQNVRLHSLISGSGSGSGSGEGNNEERRPGSNSSASTVKAVGTAL
ncbi:hypothetical protein B0T21DRAFT_172522 [Apiosordaria backusii]|uniref:Uncharacterized protein n=1 Tax=Apiosordaria backusii TaxID=314023 RepID=A0AA40BKN6_9PEZI|nr:hypothetical protein B0T21DRAFT_172522 [Apiosordaria backusii]